MAWVHRHGDASRWYGHGPAADTTGPPCSAADRTRRAMAGMGRWPPYQLREMTMAAIRRAEATWSGDSPPAPGWSPRCRRAAPSPTLPVSWAARTESPDGKTSPEELLAAAHAVLLRDGLVRRPRPRRHAARTARRHRPRSRSTSSMPAGGSCRAHLTVRGRVPGIIEEDFVAAAEAAKDGCPISQALKGNVELSVDADARGLSPGARRAI